MTDHKDDLLPCPFCGCDPDGYEGRQVYCRCGAAGPITTTGDEEASWNTRAYLAQPSIDVSNWDIKLRPISAEELAAAKSQEIKAAEAAALRKAAEVAAHAALSELKHCVACDGELSASDVDLGAASVGVEVIDLIDDQSSALDEYVNAKVDEALERAAHCAETEGVHPTLNIGHGGPTWYQHGQRIAAAIRAMKGKK